MADEEVVHNQGEIDQICLVFEKSWCSSGGDIFILFESGDEDIACYSSHLW